MKTFKLLLIALLFSCNSFSQIKTVEIKEPLLIGAIATLGETHIDCTKIDNTYTFYYQDTKFNHLKNYKSFSFEDTDNAFESLYEMIMQGFENTPDKDVMIELPKSFVWLRYVKALGVVNFRFSSSVNKAADTPIGFSIYMTKKKVSKLFGKKKPKKKRRKRNK